MSTLMIIVWGGIAVFVLRISGLLLQDLSIPPALDRGLSFVPVAVVAALFASTMQSQVVVDPLRIAALLASCVLLITLRRMWAGILGGLAAYLIIRFLVG